MTTTADPTLEGFLDARRQEIERGLATWFAALAPAAPPVVADAMKYSLFAGGKRLRPLLTLAAADAVAAPCGVPRATALELALPAACAIEMIHTYSLIHDDLPAMDDDTLRRGRPTLHVVAGDGMAILAGDGLQALAFILLASEPASLDVAIQGRKLQAIRLVAEAAGPTGMVGGQALDLAAVRPGPQQSAVAMNARDLEAMHARKTGALIRAAVGVGAVMAGAPQSLVDAVDGFAAEIGLAFQIVDDILDVESASATLGKTAGKDAAAGKPTYPSLYGLERSHELATACLARAESALARVGLADSHLAGLGTLAVARRS